MAVWECLQSRDCRLPVFPVIMQASSSTHANYERHAQHHVLPNYGRERAPSSASLHPDLHLTRRRSSGGHLAQVALLQGGPPSPRGRPHHQSEELGDISIPAPQYGQDACIMVWWGRNDQLFFLFIFGSKIGWILNPWDTKRYYMMFFWSSVFFRFISIQFIGWIQKDSLPMQRHLVRKLVSLPSTCEAPCQRQWFSGLPSVEQRTTLQSDETHTILLRIPSTAACRVNFQLWEAIHLALIVLH